MKHLAFFSLFLLLTFSANAQLKKRSQLKPIADNSAIINPNPALPLTRVILYSNGVAYFERRGTVRGHAEINLAFKQSQVDDILKSLVVLDLGKGRIGAVSYNSSAPPSARLGEIPFTVEAATNSSTMGGMSSVLRQLQGAKVAITTNTSTATGSILTVEERRTAELLPARTLIISTEKGELQSFDLSEVHSIKILDEGSKHDLSEFANATASARRRDSKTISITSDGEGAREMVVSYTVDAPIWKTNYRVVLDKDGKPFFQGWAIVDNVSEEDWSNVQLSLVSGSPISFIQPVQQPLYRHRPVVPIKESVHLKPQIISEDISADQNLSATVLTQDDIKNLPSNEDALRETLQALAGPGNRAGGAEVMVNGFAGARLPSNSNLSVELYTKGRVLGAPLKITEALTSKNSGVDTAAQGTEIGDLFEYKIDLPVTVLRNRSALIPILQTKLDGERVSFYYESGNPTQRPMSSVRLKNISNLTFESGALTVFDGDAYAGEALLERLKPNEQRFIPFALDLGTLITTKFKSEKEPVFLARAVNGEFETHYFQIERKTYTIVNQTDKKRTVFIEHPYHEGWKLSDSTPKIDSRSLTHYRFRVELEPHATLELPIIETQALQDTYQISLLKPSDIELFYSRKYIDDATKTELEKLQDINQQIHALQTKVEALENENTEIENDQKRLRENIEKLKSTPEAKQLITRYIAKADAQETRIEQIAKETKAAEAEQERLQAELAKGVKEFKFDRKI